jgi:hypothetical protein
MNTFFAFSARLGRHLLFGLIAAPTRLFQDGKTVPGTTEGMLTMGIVIVLTILVPIVVTRRKWMR